MSRKKLIIGLVLFIVILGSVLYVWNKETQKEDSMYKQTQVLQTDNKNQDKNTVFSDTSDWKTYRDENIGVEFKYPGNWSNLSLPNNLKGIGLSEDNNKHVFEVVYYNGFDDLGWKPVGDPSNFLYEYVKESRLSNIKRIDINGQEAYMGTEYNKIINYTGLNIWVINKGRIYELSFSDTNDLNDIQKNIISSFKFI